MVVRSYNYLNIGIVVALAILLAVGGPYLLNHIALARHNSVANGLLADMLITFPAVYYFCIIRPFKLRVWSLLLVLTCSCSVAYFILPFQQQQYILQVRKISASAEIGVVLYAFSKIKLINAQYRGLQVHIPDTPYHIQQSITLILGKTLAIKVLACELTVLRFGLLCWRRVAALPNGARRFSTYRDCGYVALFGVIIFVMLVEVFAVHLLLMHYSALAAYIVSALSAYGMLFLVADLSALLKCDTVVFDNNLLLRTGMRWRILTSPVNICTITKLNSSFEPNESCFEGAIIKSSANLHIRFKQPVTVNRLYRSPVLVTELTMSIDNPDAFIAALPAT